MHLILPSHQQCSYKGRHVSTKFCWISWFYESFIRLHIQNSMCQVNLDISGSPNDNQWGSRKYPHLHSTMWAAPLIYFGHRRGCQIWDYVPHVEHVSCVITNCGQHQWVIPSLSIGLQVLLEENTTRKITIPIFRLVLHNFAIPGYFPYILFYCCLFSLLSSGWFVVVVCGSISAREVVKH